MISLIHEYPISKEFKTLSYGQTAWYQKIHRCVCAVLACTPYDMSVILVGDEKIKELYTVYKKRNRVTDVLSFFYEKIKDDPRPHGEIFICIPQALRQVRRYHTSMASEMMRLAVHGFLHVYGCDHQKARDRVVMRSLERASIRLCKKEKCS